MTTALYARVSTDDQSLDRQQEETWSYAVDDLDVDPDDDEGKELCQKCASEITEGN